MWKRTLIVLVLFFSTCFAVAADYQPVIQTNLSNSIVVSNHPWKEKKSMSFVLYYNNIDRELLNKISESADAYYWALQEMLSLSHVKWEGQIFIYDTKEEYLAYSKAAQWSGGCADMQSNSIKTYLNTSDLIIDTLPHEITHLFLKEYFENPVKIPLWLNEGIAQYLAGGLDDAFSRHTLRYKKNMIPFDKIITMSSFGLSELDEKKVHAFYMESFFIVNFLSSKYGKWKFSEFVKTLKDGSSMEDSLKWAFGYWDFKQFYSELDNSF
jgi:hypothetical protein